MSCPKCSCKSCQAAKEAKRREELIENTEIHLSIRVNKSNKDWQFGCKQALDWRDPMVPWTCDIGTFRRAKKHCKRCAEIADIIENNSDT